MLTQTLSL